MEQQEQRRMFVKQLNEFCNLVVLNKAFWNGLQQHPYSEYLGEVEVKYLTYLLIFLIFTFAKFRNSRMNQLKKPSFFLSLLEEGIHVMK
jgi:hypothetical protein